MIKSLMMAATLTLPLSTCGGGVLDLTTPRPAARACPDLPEPPAAAIDALQAANKLHPEVGKWVVDLDQAYDQIDACRAAK